MTLEMAVLHKDALMEARARTVHDPRLRWWHLGYETMQKELDKNTWSSLEMVSVVDGAVIGEMSCEFRRVSREADALSFVRFDPSGRYAIRWARDMSRFIWLLFTHHGMHAVRWSVAVGSPHERSYDKLCHRLGGRPCAYLRGAAVISDGTRHDYKQYEVLASELQWNFLIGITGGRVVESRARDQAHSEGEGSGRARRQGDGDDRARSGSGVGAAGTGDRRGVLRPGLGLADSGVGGGPVTA